MSWLVLFDVDGTLLLTHDEVYVEANRLALNEVYGAAPGGPDVPGDTAPSHTRRALAAAGFSTEQIDAGWRWCKARLHYVRLLAGPTSHWELDPVRTKHSRHGAPGAPTGNPPAVAQARMQRLGLAAYFPAGHGALAASSAPSLRTGGARAGDWSTQRTVGVGDTPPTSSAHAAGCRSIGVTTGATTGPS